MKIPRVALLMDRSRFFEQSLLRGIAKYSSDFGPWSFIQPEDFYIRDDKAVIQDVSRLKKSGISGIIMRETSNTDEIISMGLPVIVSTYKQKDYSNVSQISVNDNDVGIMGADHLLSKGFSNVAFCGYDDFYWSHERGVGFSGYANEAGLEAYVFKGTSDFAKMSNSEKIGHLTKWIESLPKPVGIMACIDELARFISEACMILDLKVPDQVAILGVDNDPLICELAYPSLSSIALNAENAGFEAAKLLDAMISGNISEKPPVNVSPLYVMPRASTEITAVDIPEIVEAINFIRENIKDQIAVQEIADAVGMSRRSLERVFKKKLNRSIYYVIKQERVSMIIHYLTKTDLSLSRIGELLGFPEESHLSRFFHKEKGVTLRDFKSSLI